ncbi:hypothetical protein IP69_04380 [Bosea sp. AAP35]|uniref:hypothetical protein n=1 Tax=Bosea sp. AAP35 TaxID=1523417 RepID=UPI0006B9BEC2|nr:hypothetical protein [Bosea sp. AAP35]KPF72042.1 hypothetical protein IP69_04380 [Bosea sp. AAP35]
MRRLILAATLALGLGAIPGAASAAPAFAGQTAAAATTDTLLVQYRGNGGVRIYESRPRYRHRGPGYRRSYGPPPHARAYGRRYNDRQWDRRW